MRVAHFVQRYPPALGGSEAYFARLSRFLHGEGDQVRVWTTNALDLEAFWDPRGRTLPAGREDDGGVIVRRCPIVHFPGQRYVLKLLALTPSRWVQACAVTCNPIAPAMWRAGLEPSVDLVHATAFPYAWPILCALRLARQRRIPFLLTPFLHLGDPRDPLDRARRAYLAPAMRYLLEQADRIFAQTCVEADALRAVGIPAERIVLQGLGVDPAECTGGDRAAARMRWRLSEDAVVIGHLANKSVEKGTVDLLEAVTGLWHAGMRFHVLLAGPEMPNFLRWWRRACPDNGSAAERPLPVVRLGALTEEQKRDFFAAIDVFALPSRSDSYGLVFLEAWANRVPCVAYRAGGVAEVIRHEQDGLLAECGDVEGLAAGLARLVGDSVLRRELGHAGQEKTRTHHCWGPKLACVRHVYQQLAG